MAYFYCMIKTRLTKDSEFVVGEAKVLNYVMAAFCLALFGYGLVDAIRRNFINIDYQSYVFAVMLLPAIYCIRKAQSKRIYIRVNRTGIYQDEKLVTGWPAVLKVYLGQKEKTGFINLKDNFQLIVEYKKDKQGFRKKIPLTNTQNKSEEEVLEAVNFFWRSYRTGLQ